MAEGNPETIPEENGSAEPSKTPSAVPSIAVSVAPSVTSVPQEPDVDLCKFCKEPGIDKNPLLECLNCCLPYHAQCSELQKVYRDNTKICSHDCRWILFSLSS